MSHKITNLHRQTDGVFSPRSAASEQLRGFNGFGGGSSDSVEVRAASVNRGKIKMSGLILLLVFLLGLNLAFLAWFNFKLSGQVESLAGQTKDLALANRQPLGQVKGDKTGPLTSDELIEKVAEIYYLPNKQGVSVVGIKNVDNLRQVNADLYRYAQNGDHLIITPNEAIIYSVEKEKIIGVSKMAAPEEKKEEPVAKSVEPKVVNYELVKNLNLRLKADSNSKILAVIKAGEKVSIADNEVLTGGWLKVNYQNQEGWLYAQNGTLKKQD